MAFAQVRIASSFCSVLRYILLVKPALGVKYLIAKNTIVICTVVWILSLSYGTMETMLK